MLSGSTRPVLRLFEISGLMEYLDVEAPADDHGSDGGCVV